MSVREYNGTQLVDYNVITVVGQLHPPEVMTPSFDVEDLTDLGRRVEVYPEYGMAIPVRSDLGPVVLRVRVGEAGPHPEIDGTPEHTWTSEEEIDLGSTTVGITSAAMPADVFSAVVLPSRRVHAQIAWVYGPQGPEQTYDQFTETVFISFW